VSQEALSFIRSMEGVEGVSVKNDALLITCDAGARMNVMVALRERGVEIRDFKTIDPSLEEAFVKLLSEKEGS